VGTRRVAVKWRDTWAATAQARCQGGAISAIPRLCLRRKKNPRIANRGVEGFGRRSRANGRSFTGHHLNVLRITTGQRENFGGQFGALVVAGNDGKRQGPTMLPSGIFGKTN